LRLAQARHSIILGVVAFVAALYLSLSQVNAAPLDVETLTQSFEPCELLHLTRRGYPGWRGDAVRPQIVNRRSLRALADHALTLSPPLTERDSFPLQQAAASSIQAAQVFSRLERAFEESGFDMATGYRFDDLEAMASAAHDRLRAERGIHSCVTFKWANKRPDMFMQPLYERDFQRIAALFSDAEFARQRGWAHDPDLTEREAFELRATRLAMFYFELLFDVVGEDIGDFIGNLNRRFTTTTVCTDEATISQSFLADVLIGDGLLTQFELIRPTRYAHRRPLMGLPFAESLQGLNDFGELTDHFAPILVRKGDGLFLVVDSWVEDGGLPPHIARMEPWSDQRENENVVALTASREHAVDRLMDRLVLKPDGSNLRVRRATTAYGEVQEYLLAAHFGGQRPASLPDPRTVSLDHVDGRWVGGASFGRY
jgi:hypothetical protein